MSTLDLHRGRTRPAPAVPVSEVSLEQWRGGSRPEGAVALVLPNTADVGEIAPDLSRFAVIVLEFPNFRDGRAYSQARLLRQRYGYAGRISARGEILRDQALFMARAGIDEVETDAARAEGVVAALTEFSAFYQQGADGSEPVWRRRSLRSRAA